MYVISPKSIDNKFFIEMFACLKMSFSKDCLSVRQAGRVLAKQATFVFEPCIQVVFKP